MSLLETGLTTADSKRLQRLRRYAYWLDDGIPLPGTRFRVGFDALLGLVPGVGDVAGATLAIAIVAEAVRRRVPRLTLLRMALNVAIDAGVGSVPAVGDIFDAVWKANRRNLALLERHVGVRSDAAPAGGVVAWLVIAGLMLACFAFAAGGIILLARLLGIM